MVYSVAGTARTHAHELGHNLGMHHDFAEINGGTGIAGTGDCAGTGIMSYIPNSVESTEKWSTCSKSNFEHHYIADGWGNGCLEDISEDICTEDSDCDTENCFYCLSNGLCGQYDSQN